jgi:hypothetical protein
MSLFKKFGDAQSPAADLDAFAQHLQQQREQQMAIPAPPWGSISNSSNKKLDVYERTQLALQQLQILFSAGELEKHELLNATRMTLSLDRENLVVVEEIIKSKLG